VEGEGRRNGKESGGSLSERETTSWPVQTFRGDTPFRKIINWGGAALALEQFTRAAERKMVFRGEISLRVLCSRIF